MTACWDFDRNPNTATGMVIGNPAETVFEEGDQVPCSQVSTIPVSQNLMVNPNWIRRIAGEMRSQSSAEPLFQPSYRSGSPVSALSPPMRR